MKILKLSFKDLINNKRFVILFILNLSLGLSGFISLTTFKSSIAHTISNKSKTILGADLSIRARRPITEEERQTVKDVLGEYYVDESYSVSMFSMVANQDGLSRLVQIKAIESNYPFYGKLEFSDSNSPKSKSAPIDKSIPTIWVYEDILTQLKVDIGDSLKVGAKKFRIEKVINQDSSSGITSNMAPRIYMSIDNLKQTGLLRQGSVANHSFLYKVNEMVNENNKPIEELRDKIFDKAPLDDLRVNTHKSASSQTSRMLNRLNDFLGLSTLVALFLAALGSAYLFRSYFNSKLNEIATLMSLGLSRGRSLLYYLYQIIALGIISTIFAFLISLFIVEGIESLTASFLPFSVDIVIDNSTIITSILIGVLGSILFCLPILRSISSIPLSILLSTNENQQPLKIGSIKAFIPYLLLVAFFYLLAIYLSKSVLIGSIFIGTFILAGLLLSLLSWVIFTKFNLHSFFKHQALKWALRDLERKKLTTLACFVSIGLGTLLLNLIPQIEVSLEQELSAPEQSKIPNLFLFDIQEDQVEELKSIVNNNNAELTKLSPMIRARLMKVNDQDFDKGKADSKKVLTREQERERRFRNRGFNLTYAQQEQESERIVDGKPFSGVFDFETDEYAEVSLEKRFADRLKLHVGDRLEFNVEGLPVKGLVTSLRTIKWTSFDPNFFVKFQPGVLEMAPKTFIATVSKLSIDKRQSIQDDIVKELSNISIINVSTLVKRLQSFMKQMSYSLKFMSILCLLVGFIVVYSIANHQAYKQRYEIGLLKSLGSTFSMIRNHYIIQFGIISLNASILGAGLSLVISYLLSWILFDGIWVFDLKTPLISVSLCILLTCGVTFMATAKSLRMRASELF